MVLNATTSAEIEGIELPTDLAEAFRQIGDCDDPPETLREGLAIIEKTLDEVGVDVSLDDMYQSEPTRHAVYIGETVEHVPCVLDALIVALTLDTDPIEIHSEPPGGGGRVKFRITGEEVTVTPESAVASFGLGYEEANEADLANVEKTLNEESANPTICSVINAFPDSEAYARWAVDVSEAGVMELSIGAMVTIARHIVEG